MVTSAVRQSRSGRVGVATVKRILAVLTLGAVLLGGPSDAASSAAPTAARPYWVFFRDHGPETSAVSSRDAVDLTPRALARRKRAARERGEASTGPVSGASRELDPSPSYVSAVERLGATKRSRSRWLNAVSVDATSAVVEGIRALPFVREVLPVANGTRDATNLAAADETETESAYRQVQMLGIPEAHLLGYRGQGVLICVLDSGFDLSHESLRHLVVRDTRDFLQNDRDVSFQPGRDLPKQAYHGTQVLSVLAGNAPGKLMGPAPDAEFLLGKTEDIARETHIEEDKWVEAVEWAEALGADILVSSLTYTTWYRPQDRDGRTAVISQAANLAFERGLLIVNSIGNYGPNERTLSPPADAPGVIAVGSVDVNGSISPFSSLGPTWDGRVKPDLVAMGSNAGIAAGGTRDGYTTGSGTSYSNPLVAGCAAIVLSAHPDWGPEAVREALLMTASRAAQPDPRYGWGIPNAPDAMRYPALEGIVTDMHTQEPIESALVLWSPVTPVDSSSVAPTDSRPSGETRSDEDGAYVIPNLPRGTYVLKVQVPGYFELTSEPLEVPPGLQDVNFALRYRGE